MLHSEEFGDQPPHEVYATLLSRSIYFASIRTMYRVLAAANETTERRAQRAPIKHVKPTLNATAPNQVWTWDITKLRGPLPGVFYFLYVTIDLFSRMVVAERENAAHAEQLFADTVARHNIAPGALIIHADRGSPMRSDGLAQLLAGLGVARSFSRPHVSDDNAFSEAQFKTLKYQPDFPGAFGSPLHARAWCQEFFAWFNDIHQHSGIALFAPADVFYASTTSCGVDRSPSTARTPNIPSVSQRPRPWPAGRLPSSASTRRRCSMMTPSVHCPNEPPQLRSAHRHARTTGAVDRDTPQAATGLLP